jgi:hypothetical protein
MLCHHHPVGYIWEWRSWRFQIYLVHTTRPGDAKSMYVRPVFAMLKHKIMQPIIHGKVRAVI